VFLNYPCIPSASISLDIREYTLVPTILFESPKGPSHEKWLGPKKPLIRPWLCYQIIAVIKSVVAKIFCSVTLCAGLLVTCDRGTPIARFSHKLYVCFLFSSGEASAVRKKTLISRVTAIVRFCINNKCLLVKLSKRASTSCK
jgi:hypothetical protein